MNNEASAIALGVIVVSAPLALAVLVRAIAGRRKPRPEASETERRSKFGLCYLVIQLLITVVAISEGVASTGMEDAPIWGLSALTTWASALSITPLLAILFDMIAQIIGGVIRKKKGA